MLREVFALVVATGVFLACSIDGSAQSDSSAGSFLRGANQPSGSEPFDHKKTGFALTESHASLSCESCHIGGKFQNTPRICEGCHNGSVTTRMPPTHPPTSQQCGSCHQTASFQQITVIDHAQASINCAACHNGSIAAGKGRNHIPTAAPCAYCHKNTVNFTLAVKFDHTGITGNCASCHNNVIALGKPQTHVPTTLPCESCHSSTVTFLGAVYTHLASDTNCVSCHNGTMATGKTTPPHIPSGAVQCSACHVQSATSFTVYAMVHSSVSGQRCGSCHNGSFLSEGTKGAYGTSSYPGHVATVGRDCLTCHGAAVSGGYLSFAGATYVHQASDTSCSNCHNGATATGHTTPPHIPVNGVQCSNCHWSSATSFVSYEMTHSAVTAQRCDSCHNGSYVGQGVKGATGSASYPGHVATGGRDCQTCHASAASGGYVGWSGAIYVHLASDTNCSSCHNGVTATGHSTPPHIPVGGVQCSACHDNSATSFATYVMDHTTVTSLRCDVCHTGSYANQGAKGAYATSNYAGHVATAGRDCVTCHAAAVSGGYASFAGAVYIHQATDTNCVACHDGTTATGHTTPPHIPVSSVQCSFCHNNTATSFATYMMNHASVTASRCDACHNGSSAGQGAKGAAATTAYPGHVPTNGADCATCHAAAVSGGYLSWAGATFTHSATDTNCSSCHNGTTATGMTQPPHIPSGSVQCSNCHINTGTSFARAPGYSGMGAAGHAAVSALPCSTCHSGAFTTQGVNGAYGTSNYPGHVATNGADCLTCHAAAASGGYVSWSGATFTHAASDTNCSSCHNGVTATGNTSPPHVLISGVQCSNCHSNTGTSFAVAPGYTGMGAAGHTAVAAARCDACHNGAFTSQGTAGGALGTNVYASHVATGGRDCSACHSSAQIGGYVSWAGAAYTHLATDTVCTNCHNGVTAKGLTTPPHIPTASTQCSNCHSNAAGSFTTYTMNHPSVGTMRCDACHNGSYITEGSKGADGTATSPGHVPTNGNDCAACHASASQGGFVSWAGGKYVHLATDANCSNCHNGQTALGLTTPPHVPVPGVQCSSCHSNTGASFATAPGYSGMAKTGHASVAADRCDSCHSGAYTSQGTTGATGTSAYPNHIATVGRDCYLCHAQAAANFVSWSGGQYVHQATDTDCASCHNGSTALGLTTPPHIPTATLQCSNCHVNTAAAFTIYTMTHSAVTSMRCDSCHSGSYLTQGAKGAYGTVSYANHVATGGRDCATCHAAAAAAFISWSGGAYIHLAADTVCSTCHNNTSALGLTTPPHIPVGGVQCSSCHSNAGANFAVAPGYSGMGVNGHAPVTSARCDACHNGSYTSQGTSGGAMGTASYAGHVATNGADCITCHASAATGGYAVWSGATFSHTSANTNCSSCHNGVAATGNSTPPHVPISGVQCSSCHSYAGTNFAVAPGYSGMGVAGHTAVSSARCDACHNGSYTSQGTAGGAMATASYAGHVATNGADCITCHAAAASGGYAAWSGATFAHTAANTNCSSCHNGSTATGNTSPPHIPATGVQCSNCHSYAGTSFAVAPGYSGMGKAGHNAVSSNRCDACHNGAYASQGTAGGAMGTASFANHVATGGRDCATCHAASVSGSYAAWTSGVYVHLSTDTACSTCHNGATALGLVTPPHIPSGSAQCSSCHSNTGTSFATAPGYSGMGATGHAAVNIMRCDACHNGSFTSQGTTGATATTAYANHVATEGRDCATCHAASVSGGYRVWSGGVYVHVAADTTCNACHNGSTALGLTTPPHVPSGSVQCSNCHSNTGSSFAAAPGYSGMGQTGHAAVSTMTCVSCHNGSLTSQGTTGALGAASYANHVALGGRDCATCHANSVNFGYASWSGGVYVHLASDTNCVTCHNGATAAGLTTPPHIPTGAIQCSNCHSNAGSSFSAAPGYSGMGTTGHSAVSAMRCDTCHSGSYTSQGATGAYGIGSYAGHVATNGADCISCHAASVSGGYVSFSGAVFTHTAANTNCSSCHNGATATGNTTPPHIPAPGVQCSNCHSYSGTSFAVSPGYSGMGKPGHTAVAASRCDSCHDGSYTSQGTTGAYSTAHYAGHVPTNGADCSTCHAAASSGGFVSWAGGTFVHTAADTNCIGCHNGTTATGAVTPPHVPTSSIQCSGCHSNTGTSFSAAPGYSGMGTAGHSVVHAIRCDACHSGTYKSQGTAGGAKGPDHSAKTQDCGCCHVRSTTNFSSWSNPQSPAAGCVTTAKSLVKSTTSIIKALTGAAPAPRPVIRSAAPAVSELSAARVRSGVSPPPILLGRPMAPGGAPFDHKTAVGACTTCHNGTTAIGKPARHILTSATCDACHKSTRTFAVAIFDHKTTNAACATCHNGVQAIGKPSKHVPTSAACDACHKSERTFGGALFNHKASTEPCATCHNGASASGKSARHLVTTATCDTCHKNVSDFGAVRFDHRTAGAAACATCHNSVIALGKPAQHIVTTASCDSCHKSSQTFSIARFDHTGAAGPCASCHNGVKAQGKPIRHPITNAPCENCHLSTSNFSVVHPTNRTQSRSR